MTDAKFAEVRSTEVTIHVYRTDVLTNPMMVGGEHQPPLTTVCNNCGFVRLFSQLVVNRLIQEHKVSLTAEPELDRSMAVKQSVATAVQMPSGAQLTEATLLMVPHFVDTSLGDVSFGLFRDPVAEGGEWIRRRL